MKDAYGPAFQASQLSNLTINKKLVKQFMNKSQTKNV